MKKFILLIITSLFISLGFSQTSSNADLSAMTISSGTLTPAFNSATTAYTATVPNAITSITVTPTSAEANATIEVQVNGSGYATATSGSASGELALNVGSNTVDVKVTAEDDTTIKTYTTTLTRLPLPSITSFTPSSGSIGTLVTITGADLSAPTALTIGGVDAVIISNTGSSLVAMVMPEAITGTISLTTAAGSTTSSTNFTVVESIAPAIQQGDKLVGTGAIGTPYQGVSVSLSADGNTAIVGGNYDNNQEGAVWVYTRSGSIWSQQGPKLVGTGVVRLNDKGAQQGCSVSLSSDDNTAIVGGLTDNGYYGAAWVYSRSGNVWSQQGDKLVGSDFAGSAQQGCSVSLSADGNTAIVGGRYDNYETGAAWVYTRSGSVWSQQGPKLVGTGAIGKAWQGSSVSLSADGNTAIVGGTYDNNQQGAVWVYTRSAGVWSQQGDKLVGTGIVGDDARQGESVSLSADGSTAVVGAPKDNNFQGAVWVYTRSAGVWSQQGPKLVGTVAYEDDDGQQGCSVSLSADGNTVIVGGWAYFNNMGAAWVYSRNDGVWTQQGDKLGLGYYGDYIGRSVSLSADGNTAMIGAYGYNSGQGAVYVYYGANTDIAAGFFADVTSGDVPLTVNFTDASTGTPTSWAWSFEGGTPSSSTNQNPTGIVFNVAGSYDVTLAATNADGSDTEIKTDYITVNETSGGTILAENFDGSTFPPTGWTQTITNSANTWLQGNASSSLFTDIDPTNVYSALCDWVAEDQDEWLKSPEFSLSDGLFTLEFYAAYNSYWLSSATLKLNISVDGGSIWTKIWEATDDGEERKWRLISLDLSTYANNANVMLAWQYVGNDGDWVGIDNVSIKSGTTGIAELMNPEISFSCSNYPNPFNSNTTILIQLEDQSDIELNVYNSLGQQIDKVFQGKLNKGDHRFNFNANDLKPGVYYYRFIVNGLSITKPMLFER